MLSKAHIVQIKPVVYLEGSASKVYLFISHIVQIKLHNGTKRSLTEVFLYIPYSSDKTPHSFIYHFYDIDFISHIVQIKLGILRNG